MTLDLRLAIGYLLLAIGVQLAGYGLLSSGAGAAMNLEWGAVVSITGAAFIAASRFGGGKR